MAVSPVSDPHYHYTTVCQTLTTTPLTCPRPIRVGHQRKCVTRHVMPGTAPALTQPRYLCAAGARIHRAHQGEVGGEGDSTLGPVDSAIL